MYPIHKGFEESLHRYRNESTFQTLVSTFQRGIEERVYTVQDIQDALVLADHLIAVKRLEA